ncbi:MFS transporter, partial [Bacillus sp. JJ664]
SYSALSNIAYTGADLIARSSIIIGAYINPTFMSIYIGFIVMFGTSLVYLGLFVKGYYIKKEEYKLST